MNNNAIKKTSGNYALLMARERIFLHRRVIKSGEFKQLNEEEN